MTYSLNEFIRNHTEDPLGKKECKQNTRILYKHLIRNIDDLSDTVTYKQGSVRVAGYRIMFRSHGFRITDYWNYGERVNINSWNSDFPTPESVMDFILGTNNREIKEPEQLKSKGELISELSKKFKLKKSETLAEMKARHDKIEAEKVKAADKKAALEKPKRAGKFRALPEMDEVMDLIAEDSNEGEYTFVFQGPTRTYKKKMLMHEYYTSLILSQKPQAMPLLVKVARGDGDVDWKSLRSKFAKLRILVAPFVHYDKDILKLPVDRFDYTKLCSEICQYNGWETPFDLLYPSVTKGMGFKVGDEIRVYFPEQLTWYHGVITQTKGGLRVKYEGEKTDEFVVRGCKCEKL